MSDQQKVHNNPFSKEGLGQQVMDMSLAIAKLSTDMDWIKAMLSEIKVTLEKNDKEIKTMVEDLRENFTNDIGELREHVDKELGSLDERVRELEKARSWMRGAIAGLSVITLILSLVQLVKILGG